MKLARAAVIVEPISDVGMLLDFAQREAAADGVDRAGRDEERIACFHLYPVEQSFDLTADRNFAQSLGADGFAETDGETRTRFGAHHTPHLSLAARILLRGGEIVVG